MSEWNEAIQKMQTASSPKARERIEAIADILKQRDEALFTGDAYEADDDEREDTAEVILAALSATEGEAEPVAWAYEFHEFGDVWKRHCILNRPDGGANPPTKHHGSEVRNVQPLYASPPSAPAAGVDSWTLADLRACNVDRQAAWCPEQVPDLSFRGNELGGEVGEALNVIKKLERERLGWRGSRDTVEHLAEELADVVICADLAALTAGVDLMAAVKAKFDATSQKVGLPHRLLAAPDAKGER